MIRPRDLHVIAQLEDGKVVMQKPNRIGSIEWSCLATDCVQIRTHRHSEALAVLTNDDRVLVSHEAKAPLMDITPTVRTLLGCAISIDSIHLSNDVLFIIAGCHIGAIRPSKKGKVPSVGPHLVLECDVDRAVFARGTDGLIKTTNNKLFLVNMLWTSDPLHRSPTEITFHDTENIREIFIIGRCFTLLMQNGSVFVYNNDLDDEEPFEQLKMPAGETVTKIISSHRLVIYLTDKGNCYHMDTCWAHRYVQGPKLLEALQGLVVENVFWLDDNRPIGIVQHDGRLTYFRLGYVVFGEGHIPPCSGQFSSYCDKCSNTVIDMRPLLFFNSKRIVSVVNISPSCTYFVTDEGHAYYTAKIGERHAYIITAMIDETTIFKRDPFFDDNPIAVEKGSQHIRSALSRLDDVR